MEKVAVIDKHANLVRANLQLLIDNDEAWDEIVTVARGRHVLGSYEFGDRNLFEWSDGRVDAERLCELADWVVYTSWVCERTLGP